MRILWKRDCGNMDPISDPLARRTFLEKTFEVLLHAFGHQAWWPADTPLEVVVGAVLTQNTAWHNVEKAIARLKQEEMLTLARLAHTSEETLADCIRSSGFFRQKARRLKAFVHHIVERWQGSLERFLAQPLPRLRNELLGLPGIGAETADSIILYAAHQPSFVVDRYTHRFLMRHGYAEMTYRYEPIRRLFMDTLPADVALFQEYHALIVTLGKRYCKTKAQCLGCPLETLLPSGGQNYDPYSESAGSY